MAKLNVVRKIESDNTILVAVSGGIDSMVALDFFLRKFGREKVMALHLNHDMSESANDEYNFVSNYCNTNDIALTLSYQPHDYEGGSLENYWRLGRKNFFRRFKNNVLITGHHLDDAVEWYLFTSFRGDAKVMPYKTENTIKPFILNKKQDFYEYANKFNVPYIEDETNFDPEFGARNAIRNNILPEVLKVNPGIHKVVKKKILENLVLDELSAQ